MQPLSRATAVTATVVAMVVVVAVAATAATAAVVATITDTPRLSSAILIRRPGVAATAVIVAATLNPITDTLPRWMITVSLNTLSLQVDRVEQIKASLPGICLARIIHLEVPPATFRSHS